MSRSYQKPEASLSTPDAGAVQAKSSGGVDAESTVGGLNPSAAFGVSQSMGNSFLQGMVGDIQRESSGGDTIDSGTAGLVMSETASRSSGKPLESGFRGQMEASFGQDFSDVRVHTDAAAVQASESLNARAFTSGNDIYFGGGNYDTGSAAGQTLAAHELAHVAQGAGGAAKSSGGPSVSSPGDASERAADAAADKAVRGEAVGDVGGAPASALQRDEEEAAPSLIEQLREEADDFFVDEALCLRLISQMNNSERAQVRGDVTLMQNLVGAFDENEIVTAVNALNFELKWKIYWIDQGGETESVSLAQYQVMMMMAAGQPQQIIDLMGWNAPFLKMAMATGASPGTLFALIRAMPAWTQVMTDSNALWIWWMVAGSAEEMLAEVSSPLVPDASVTNIVNRMKSTGAFAWMLGALPRGATLTQDQRRGLRRLAGILPQPDCGQLFEVRFNKPLTAAAGVSWVVEDIRPVWDQLDVLPDQDVSENTILTTFRAISGDAGFANGDGSIELGNGLRTSTFWGNGPTQSANNGTPNPERLGHTVRHEIGHQVHTALQSTVDSWLQAGIGFWYHPGTGAGVDTTITELGGWPSKFRDKRDQEVEFTAADKTRIQSLITSHSGSSTWGPNGSSPLPVAGSVARDATLPAGTAMTQAERDVLLWDALPGAVRTMFTTSDTGPWYINYTSHPTGTRGRYFWNHWYSKPYYFSGTALSAINATGDNYSSMSEAEFFANCYAEYFKDPAGYNDPTKWGGSLNGTVKDFFKRCVVDRQPYTPPSSSAASPAATGSPTGKDGSGSS